MKRVFIFGLAAFFVFLVSGNAICQDEAAASDIISAQGPVQAQDEAGALDVKEPETQWIYGEVVNLDPQNKAILIKTLDYETDQEKEIAVTVDEKTSFENIKSLDEIKPNDTVSVDYVAAGENKNVAKNISLERLDAQQVPLDAGQAEAAPALKSDVPEEVVIP